MCLSSTARGWPEEVWCGPAARRHLCLEADSVRTLVFNNISASYLCTEPPGSKGQFQDLLRMVMVPKRKKIGLMLDWLESCFQTLLFSSSLPSIQVTGDCLKTLRFPRLEGIITFGCFAFAGVLIVTTVKIIDLLFMCLVFSQLSDACFDFYWRLATATFQLGTLSASESKGSLPWASTKWDGFLFQLPLCPVSCTRIKRLLLLFVMVLINVLQRVLPRPVKATPVVLAAGRSREVVAGSRWISAASWGPISGSFLQRSKQSCRLRTLLTDWFMSCGAKCEAFPCQRGR